MDRMFLMAALISFLLSCSPRAEENAPPSNRTIKDVEYVQADGKPLLLDLYLPSSATNPPLLVWIHGGAWRSGSKAKMPLSALVGAGYATASVEYRLSTEAKFPALVHDIKAAIRFLRAKQGDYGYDARRVGIVGSSAGGHLAALVGVTNGNAELEGTLGEYTEASSSVQAIVAISGPTNFMTILPQSTPHGLSVRVPALELLLGGQPEALPDLAKLASPVNHVDATDPPLLLFHGDQDPQVPINQSHELHGKYKELGLDVRFEVVHGAAHGGAVYFDETRIDIMRDFLDGRLKSN